VAVGFQGNIVCEKISRTTYLRQTRNRLRTTSFLHPLLTTPDPVVTFVVIIIDGSAGLSHARQF
jgi:transposase-like protein